MTTETPDLGTVARDLTRTFDRLVSASYDQARPVTVAESEAADIVAGCLRELRAGIAILTSGRAS